MESNQLQAVVVAEPARPEALNELKEELDKLEAELRALVQDWEADPVAARPQLRLQKS
jgi:hypothetical protein